MTTAPTGPSSPKDPTSGPDVVIVGYGPVGATLAGLLARRGRRVTVIDRDVDVYPLPRAAHIDHEILRILQEVGCVDQVVADARVNTGMDFLTADHQVLLAMRTPTARPYGWPSSVFFNQPRADRTLRDTVEALGVQVLLGKAVVGVTVADESVRLDLDDGTTISAPWVVGCDGARSTVRKALGITMHDLDFEEPWLVVDLVLERPAPHLPERALQVCDPARPHTVVPMPDPRFRFEFMLLPGEDPEVMQDPGTVERLLAPWLEPGAARLERSAVYTFHGLIATEWRSGRVLLAGDAAHQMPPFLGQGMCSGMRDAANLAWKLDAVLDGAPAELLDTYQPEREPHVRAIVESAVGFGRIICTTDAAVAAQRDAAMLAAKRPQADEGSGEEPEMARRLDPGTLVLDGGGGLALQPTLDGALLDDLVGPRWLVVTRDRSLGTGDAADAWRELDAILLSADEHPEVASLLDRAGLDGISPKVVIVRPDRYVYVASDLLVAPPELAFPASVAAQGAYTTE